MIDPQTILLPAGTAMRAVPITAAAANDWPSREAALAPQTREWLKATRFRAEPGQVALSPGPDGNLARVFLGLGEGQGHTDPFLPGKLARSLPEGVYYFDGGLASPRLAALGWLLESYRYDAYRKEGPS